MPTCQILAHGIRPDELNDREKEDLAVKVHRILEEDFDVHPDAIDVEGYRGGEA